PILGAADPSWPRIRASPRAGRPRRSPWALHAPAPGLRQRKCPRLELVFALRSLGFSASWHFVGIGPPSLANRESSLASGGNSSSTGSLTASGSASYSPPLREPVGRD